MAERQSPIVPGTLEMLVLKTLSLAPAHGWAICEQIEQRSGRVFIVNQGSLYPALERLLQRGWITSDWRITESNRRARYYLITRAGRERLREERAEWDRASAAINLVLQGT